MSWSEEMIEIVLGKGKVVKDNDPNVYRKDQCGALIRRNSYGNRDSQYGWEIDHISPGGPNIPSNLRPLQWRNNVDKSSGRLKCRVTAKGNKNVEKTS
jgi:hypothetical protein